MIKAIETEYKGYKFRSRLEARWAVFFDVGHIRYEYEPEGYKLENGTLYLPDFYLPDLDIYVEVKRDTEEGIREVEAKCSNVITWGSPVKSILILSDVPEGASPDGGIWHFPVIYWSGHHIVWGWFFFHDEWPDHDHVVGGNISAANYPDSHFYLFGDYPKRIRHANKNSIKAVSDFELLRYINENYEWSISQFCDPREIQEATNEMTFKAYKAARQARFEHGEKPII